jgi:hypothetical protein
MCTVVTDLTLTNPPELGVHLDQDRTTCGVKAASAKAKPDPVGVVHPILKDNALVPGVIRQCSQDATD